jgi:hypothetical protein
MLGFIYRKAYLRIVGLWAIGGSKDRYGARLELVTNAPTILWGRARYNVRKKVLQNSSYSPMATILWAFL